MKRPKNKFITKFTTMTKLTYALLIGLILAHTLIKSDISNNAAHSPALSPDTCPALCPATSSTSQTYNPAISPTTPTSPKNSCLSFETYDYNNDEDPLWLTVFVHGIVSIQPYLSFNNFMRFMRDDIKGTYYEKSVSLIRENEFFYKNQAMGPIGLHYVDTRQPHNATNNSSLAMAYAFEQMQKLAGDEKAAHRYYLFGWSGLLSPSGRYEDAKKLFELLDQEVQRLKNTYKNKDIRIRLIGYSHGGNVALNLGAIHQDLYPTSPLSIDELILIGTPIQHDTDYMINDPIFKKVYNIYSYSDRVQKIDFFSWKRFLSGRTFIPYNCFTLPKKLTQIQLKIMRHKKQRKKHTHQPRTFDPKKRGIVSGHSSLLRNASPGHAELWMFGWTPLFYRPHYPLYPLPTISILPFILKSVKEYHNFNQSPNLAQSHIKKHNFARNRSEHIIMDIRPDDEYILIKNQKTKALKLILPFIPTNILKDLQNRIALCAAQNYTRQEYEYNIRKAIKESKKIYQCTYRSKKGKNCGRRCRVKAVALAPQSILQKSLSYLT